MNTGRFRLLTWLIPGLMVLLLLLPRLVWLFSSSLQAEAVIINPEYRMESGGEIASWIFKNLKYSEVEFPGFSSPKNMPDSPDHIYVSGFPEGATIDESILAADRLKDYSRTGERVFFDTSVIGEKTDRLSREILEDFLRIKTTGWTVKYLREPLEDMELSDPIISAIKASGADMSKPVLILSERNGENIILQAGRDFSGKPPEALLDKQNAPVYGWINIIKGLGNTETYGRIDLQLTESGKHIFEEKELSTEIPLIFRNRTAFTDTSIMSVSIETPGNDQGDYRYFLKPEYMSRIALFRPGSSESFNWRIFIPWFRNISRITNEDRKPDKEITYSFRTGEKDIYLSRNHDEFTPFYIKGVNLGTALPGKWFTEFPQDEHLYYRWFEKMKTMNLNTIRIYTLLPPVFYRALYTYNTAHPQTPLFLLQEIWPEEHPPGNNYLDSDYNEAFIKEIAADIDAVHGNRYIPPRDGRAWGDYTADVSKWTAGFLIGRELEPDEVSETNLQNPEKVYRGRYISSVGDSATEAWLAEACDFAADYEKTEYSSFRPLGIVSWPTLDEMKHPSEWNDPELGGKSPYNDRAAVDIDNIECSEDFVPGIFGAYHIYPNYPDFMNNQEEYSLYTDAEGTFRYGGYLRDFIDNHNKYPAIVAEYGLSTSSTEAHMNPDGYHHGGLTEKEQTEGIRRMTEAIRREGYAGSVIFEWIDEWAKKTWTTEPYMIPYDRHNLWHNILDPEQNYGLVSMESASAFGKSEYISGDKSINAEVWGSEGYLYIRLKTGFNIDDYTVCFALSTYSPDRGIFRMKDVSSPEFSDGMEFLIRIEPDSEESVLLAAESYNQGLFNYSSRNITDQDFTEIKVLVNRAFVSSSGKLSDPEYSSYSTLRHGTFTEVSETVHTEPDSVTVRIPWGLINVSDPSQGIVIDDDRKYYAVPGIDVLSTTVSSGIVINGMLIDSSGKTSGIFPETDGEFSSELRLNWKSWNSPEWIERDKQAVAFLSSYFGGF